FASTPNPMTRMATRTCLAASRARTAGIQPNVQIHAVTPTVAAVHRICQRRNRTQSRRSPSPRATRGGVSGGAIWIMDGLPARANLTGQDTSSLPRVAAGAKNANSRKAGVVALDNLRLPFQALDDEGRPAGAVIVLVDRQRATQAVEVVQAGERVAHAL